MTTEIGDDDPVPLAKAAELFFQGNLTKSSLRTEAAKGNLEIIRIANRDFVTRRAIQKMIERCTIPAKPSHTLQALGTSPKQAAKAALARVRDTIKPDKASAKEALKAMLEQRHKETP